MKRKAVALELKRERVGNVTLYCIALYCIALHCTTIYNTNYTTFVYYITPSYTVLHYSTPRIYVGWFENYSLYFMTSPSQEMRKAREDQYDERGKVRAT